MNSYILHLETATKVCSVALSLNGVQIACKESASDEYIHGEQLTNFISDVLLRAKISIKNLSAVSVSSGPGSYTGLRIGVSTAKGMCFGLSIPLISVPSLISLISIAEKKYPGITICALFDARRMEVFSQIIDKNKDELKKVGPEIIDAFTYSQFDPFLAVGDGTQKVKELWANRHIQFDDLLQPSAIGQIDISYQKYILKEFEDVAYFVPDYGKEFYTN